MFSDIDLKAKRKKNDDFFLFKVYSRQALNNCNAKNKVKDKNQDKNKKDKENKCMPKIDAIIKKMKKANGPSLVYSQYRGHGGISAVSDALDRSGYKQVTFRKNKLVGEQGGKHYIVFPVGSGAAAKIDLLIKAFNKEIDTGFNIQCVLITQAGSEGISLKGVRQVHILDPYWNYIRLKQIIGRAVRAKSHLHLPKSEQNVETYLYLSTFAKKEQIEDMAWDKGKLSIVGKTSDEMVYAIALKKQAALDRILEFIKITAMDCHVHLKAHQKTEPKLKCVT